MLWLIIDVVAAQVYMRLGAQRIKLVGADGFYTSEIRRVQA